MSAPNDVPAFFVYGEPSRALDVGFLHVETVMERRSLHFGRVAPHKHPLMGQITYWFKGEGRYRIEGVKFSMSGWWELKFDISAPAGTDTVTFNLVL